MGGWEGGREVRDLEEDFCCLRVGNDEWAGGFARDE